MKNWLITSFALLSSMCFITNANANDCRHHHRDNCWCPVECAVFGSFYTKDDVKVAPEFGIPFDSESDNIHHSPGIEHTPGSADFIIKKPGIYRIIYSVSLGCEGKVALTLDGVVVPGSEMFIEKEEQLSTIALLIKVCHIECCGKVLRVINHNPIAHGWVDNNIHLKAGKRDHNVTAAIVIEKAAECCNDCRKREHEHEHEHDHDHDHHDNEGAE